MEKTPEELKAEIDKLTADLEASNKTAAEKAQEAETLKKRTLEQEELLRQQGRNFKKLRDLTAEEKGRLTEKERELMERQEAVEQQNAELTQREIANTRKSLFTEIVGTNPKLREEVETEAKELGLDSKTSEADMRKIIEKAALIKGIGGKKEDPIQRAHEFAGQVPIVERSNSFADTDAGKTLGSQLGLRMAKKK